MENYFNKIQDYLDGLLSVEDVRDFEATMIVNEELREDVQLQKRINEVLYSRMKAGKDLNDVKSTIEKSSKKYFGSPSLTMTITKPSRKIFSLRNWGIAVGIAACFLIGLTYFGIFSSNLESLPALQSEVTRGSINQNEIDEAITTFNNKDYKKSIQLFTELTKKDTIATRFKYYLGLSYIGDKQWNEAVKILIPVANGPSLYSEKSAYFTAVAARELKNKNLAIEYAKKVSKSSQYYKKAQRLIRKID